jgi:Fur family transcriptional regulator, ferric uptake regulator
MTPAEILNHHHLRKTPARLCIVQYLQESKKPLSENEMRAKMKESYDRITFYRTAQALVEAGVIHRIAADNTHVRYALNSCTHLHHVHENNHVHFYCTQCENVECMSQITIQDYLLPDGYNQEDCSVIIKGICKRCATKK